MMNYVRTIIIVTALLSVFCTPYLLYEETIPKFVAPADKALIVIYRGENPFGVDDDDAEGWFYVDGKFAAGNDQETIISFNIDPGKHFILGHIDGYCKIRGDFKAGKVYYLQHKVFPIMSSVWSPVNHAGHTLTFRTPEEKEKDFKAPEDDFKYARFNPEHEIEEMDDGDYEEEMESYQEWLKENADEAKKDLEYPGY
jgi:hypothetical protein